MSEITIRMAAPEDAQELLAIYDYYVKETAITFEYDTPSVEEFKGRIEKVLEKFPYLVAEEVYGDETGADGVIASVCEEPDGVTVAEGEVAGKAFAGEGTGECSDGTGIASGAKSRVVGYAYASPFHERAAYQWCVEMSIYLDKDYRGRGLGRLLYNELERRLGAMGILNLNSCIGYPDEEDEYLTFDSVKFHEKMGYSMVGEFHKCGYKFGRWYNMVWMEKLIREHK